MDSVLKKVNKSSMVLIALGFLLLLFGLFTSHGNHLGQQLWANLLVNSFFYFTIALAALFFIALQYVSQMAWGVTTQRVLEGMMAFMPIGAVLLIIVFFSGAMHWHHLYHWMDDSVMHEYVIEKTLNTHHPEYSNKLIKGAIDNPDYDKVIFEKSGYLNQPFFWARTLLYLGVWLFFAKLFRKKSLLEDKEGGLTYYKKNIFLGVLFIAFFAYTSSSSSWDWLMSIDTHWFSTLYGWYTFSGMWVSCALVTLLIVIFLKKNNLLAEVNASHIHDWGKWVFAISMLWSYLWFSQFMLIWYSDIPEEVSYYQQRFHEYPIMYLGTFALNFILPFFVLMSRDAKRNFVFLVPVCVLLFLGHWLDVLTMVLPGTMYDSGTITMIEIGMFILFLGVFIKVVFSAIAKAALMPKNHPMFEESKHLHT